MVIISFIPAQQMSSEGKSPWVISNAHYLTKLGTFARASTLNEVRAEFESRFSFCCADCRKRKTSTSVRFLGRRVYLALAVVLCSARHAGQNTAAARVSTDLAVPVRTLQRWRQWWVDLFPLTPLWQAHCARFMPPVDSDLFPAGLLERFVGEAAEQLMRLLVFLSPISVTAISLSEGR